MPGEMTTPDPESLFSLELVVEKVYVPHTPCRFPAVVFRLLDFPTIVISHVEDDLEKAIRRKISLDPHYHLPDQFSELKDRHGNFMIKKGKSCLFKISADILKQHLASTPLYVMAIDMFPEVPKLIGNSTVPLNSLMDSICVDIARLGATVPSVHGDKGLFKLYNLMGKEIGYFVLGFRLLCLGPSLIAHLPASALMQRHGAQKKRIKHVEEMLHTADQEEDEESDEPVVELRNSACMTEPIKHDVLLQTIEMDDKAVHVEVGGTEMQTQTNFVYRKESSTTATQTDKKKKLKEALNAKQKWVEQIEHKVEDDDVIIHNIVCPPPLFYNSEATPSIEIERQHQVLLSQQDDISVEDLSDIESYDGQGLHKPKRSRSFDLDEQFPQAQLVSKSPKAERVPQQSSHLSSQIPQARAGEFIQGLQVAPRSNAVFPLLTALINELSCIQDPQLLLNVSNRIQTARPRPSLSQRGNEQKSQSEEDKISPAVVSAVAAALSKKLENSKDNIRDMSRQADKAPSAQNLGKGDRPQRQTDAPKGIPSQAAKKNKLAFGLTNTQRLRLQKTNPAWLKQAEQQAEKIKSQSQKQPPAKKLQLDDMNATTFSDTLTEVRRLAEKELESTAGGDTLLLVASEVEEMNSTLGTKEMSKKPLKKTSSGGGTPSKSRLREFSPQHKPRGNAPLPKARTRLRHRRESQQNNMKDSSDSDEVAKKRPVPLERHTRNIKSPVVADQEGGAYNENEEILSARSDLPSSRSRSIEVHLPSAKAELNDTDTITDAEDDDEDIPLPDESLNEQYKPQSVNLPQYIAKNTSLPDSIDGVPNASLNVSGALDDNSPLESTRHSRNMTEEQNDSRVLQSTDYDTRQFHSTDEPELQELMSEEENRSGGGESGRRSAASLRTSQKFPVINPQLSENSPVPSVRRSTTKLDVGAHSYLPSMSLSKGQVSPVSSRPNSRPSTPKGKNPDNLQPLNPKGGVITPRNSITPRSMSPSPKRPTPRQKKPLREFRESIHTESLSSYMPSDPENLLVSLSSNSGGNYSDDFQPLGSGESGEPTSSVEQLPKIVPSTRLGYTIT
ncbi:microtubule-associated protein 10 [Aplysia californica]|uniref:Microtubule-associated protein 10 n=1 Tax=Aplysia californica TaxID=6500 RepID=A0ABM0K0P3_APLCA|nr:microtubule-associated protein 10 [Aplysia californica]